MNTAYPYRTMTKTARHFSPRENAEWQASVRHVRAAARHGQPVAKIAAKCALSVASVERILTPADHPRLSDPADLLRTGHVLAGRLDRDVQLYWIGFLTSAGYIRGHGNSLTLVVTLGEDGRRHVTPLMADLMTDNVRCEFCHSSLVGWQGYFRDPLLCHALFPWGIRSDLYGEDPALLEDVPEKLFATFLRGYVEGGELAHRSPGRPRRVEFVVRGTSAILTGLDVLIKRHWGISSGVVKQVGNDAELRFANRAARDAAEGLLSTAPSRLY